MPGHRLEGPSHTRTVLLRRIGWWICAARAAESDGVRTHRRPGGGARQGLRRIQRIRKNPDAPFRDGCVYNDSVPDAEMEIPACSRGAQYADVIENCRRNPGLFGFVVDCG